MATIASCPGWILGTAKRYLRLQAERRSQPIVRNTRRASVRFLTVLAPALACAPALAASGGNEEGPITCEGKSFFVVGRFDLNGDGRATDEEKRRLAKRVRDRGGRVLSGAPKKVDYLLLGDIIPPDPPRGTGNQEERKRNLRRIRKCRKARRKAENVLERGASLLGLGPDGQLRPYDWSAQLRACGHYAVHQPLKNIDFCSARLGIVLTFTRDVTGWNLVVDWEALAAIHVTEDTEVRVQLQQVPAKVLFREALRQAGPGACYVVERGRVYVSTRNKLAVRTEQRAYDVRALARASKRRHGGLRDASARIADALCRGVDPEGWNTSDGKDSLAVHPGRLIITQTPRNHMHIARALAECCFGKGQGVFSRGFRNTWEALQREVAVNYEGTELRDVVWRLRDTLGLNVVGDWPVLQAAGVAGKAKVSLRLSDVTAKRVLDAVVQSVSAKTELAWTTDEHGTVVISTRKALASRPIPAVYDVRRWLSDASGPQYDRRVSDVLSRIVGSLDLDRRRQQRGREAFAELNGRLIVTATAAKHEKIAEALRKMRGAGSGGGSAHGQSANPG